LPRARLLLQEKENQKILAWERDGIGGKRSVNMEAGRGRHHQGRCMVLQGGIKACQNHKKHQQKKKKNQHKKKKKNHRMRTMVDTKEGTRVKQVKYISGDKVKGWG